MGTIDVKWGLPTEYTECQAFCLVVRRPNWLVPPTPPQPQMSVTPPLWVQGGRHTSLGGGGEGVWGPNSDEGTDTLVLCVYYNPSTGTTLRSSLRLIHCTLLVKK
jgi:hypothetical protein